MGFTDCIQVIQEGLYVPEIVRIVNLWAGLRPPDTGYAGHARRRPICFCIQQVKLDFGCHDDLQAHLPDWRRGVLQHKSRVSKKRFAVSRVEAE